MEKLLITAKYKAPKMNASQFVDILMNHLFEIGEKSKTSHVVCGDFNTDIRVSQIENRILYRIYMP